MMKDGFEPTQTEIPALARREVLIALGSMSLLAAFISLTRELVRFLMPPISRAQPPLIVGGSPADYPSGVLMPLANAPVFIGRDEQGLFALSAICTHLGCTISQRDAELICPCHGSRFSLNGANLAGPATRPLAYLTLTLNAAGLIEIHVDQPATSTFRLNV